MHRFSPLKSFAIPVAIVVLALASHGQSTTPASNAQPVNILAEDERLPFMQIAEEQAPQEPSSTGLIVKSIGALALVIGLLFVGAWTMKKFGFGGKAVNGSTDEVSLSIVSTLTLGSGRTLSTIRFGDRVLLIGSTPQNFTLLAQELPPGENHWGNPRSVAEMLADDERAFEDEFQIASRKLGVWENGGGVA